MQPLHITVCTVRTTVLHATFERTPRATGACRRSPEASEEWLGYWTNTCFPPDWLVRCCSSPQSRSCPSVTSISLIDSGRRVNLTHDVIGEIEQVLADLQDAETGQRGFLLTGDERFLEPYNAALAHLPDQIRALREVTADNPQQQAAVGMIETMATQKLAALKEGIDRRRRQPVSIAPAELDLLQSGRAIMDRIRSEVTDMRTREESTLDDARSDARRRFPPGAAADPRRKRRRGASSCSSSSCCCSAKARGGTPRRSTRRSAPPRSKISTTTRLAAITRSTRTGSSSR